MTASNFSLTLPGISNDAGSTGNLISAAMNWNPTLRLIEPDGPYNQAGNPANQESARWRCSELTMTIRT